MKFPQRRLTPPTSVAWLFALSATAAFAAPDQGPGDQPAASSLSAPETLAQAKDYQTKMQDNLRTIVQLQDVAKKQKDIIKLNCVNDKLVQVKGHLAVGDQALASLNEAVAKNDDGGRQQEYTKVTILFQKVLLLTTEAKNCVGEDLSYVGATSVTEEVPPYIPHQDVTAFPFPSLDTQRPPVASASL